MNVLVTGSAGFIGSHLCKQLVSIGENVISLIHDHPIWTPWLCDSIGRTTKVFGDIRNFHFLKRIINI